jgi:hypothetical protein
MAFLTIPILRIPGSRLVTSAMQRHERVLEYVIRHSPALGDPLRLVECPVDA